MKPCYESRVTEWDGRFNLTVVVYSCGTRWVCPVIPLVALTWEEAEKEAETKVKGLSKSMGGTYRNGTNRNKVAEAADRGPVGIT